MPENTTDQFATINSDGSVVNARLKGPSIGEREGDIIRGSIESYLDDNAPTSHVVLDFSEVEFLNSAGIGSCIRIQQVARKNGANTVLVGLTKDVRQILKITKLDSVFAIADNEKQLQKLTKK